MLLQIEEVITLAGIEYVSVLGLLLLIILGLLWYVRRLLNDIKEKDNQLIGFIEKYYVIATKINEFLEGRKNV